MPGFDRDEMNLAGQGKFESAKIFFCSGLLSMADRDAGDEAASAQEQFMAAIESVSDGFALFDADDRMVFCNSRFKKQNPDLAPKLVPGISFEEMLRDNVAANRILNTLGDDETFIRRRMEQHRNPSGPLVQQRRDGCWLELREERTPEGGTFLVNTDITERVRAETALRESEERFRAITEASPVPLIITRRSDGKILYANPRVGPALGLSADEMNGRKATEFFWDPSGREDRLAALAKDGYVRDDEIDMRTADGSRISTIHSLKMIEYQGEEAVFGGFYDITERKRAERELRQSEERFRDMTANVPGIVFQFSIDAAGESSFSYVSPAIKDILGIEVANTVADPNAWFDIIHPDDRPGLDASIAKSYETLEPWLWEGRMLRVSGETGWFRGSSTPRKQEDGSVLWTGLVLDVTEGKQAEKALRESEARLSKAAEMSKIGYWMWDSIENKNIYCSDELAKMHGVASGTELVARFSSCEAELEWVHPEDRERYVEAVRSAIEMKRGYDIEYRIIDTVGEVHHLHAIGEQVLDERGEVIRSNGITQDITEQKRAEEQLRQAQKMEAVGQLTGGVAHDFNNLLAAVLGHAEIVEDKLGESDESVKAIIRAAERGAQLTQRLLAFSRSQPLNSRSVDLGELVGDVHKLLQRTLGETIDIEIAMAPSLWNAVTDPGQLENALLNLAINARDAMPDGGRLIISAANQVVSADDTASHMNGTPGDYVTLSVTDTGTGMLPEVMEHAFEPFFTTKDVGEGSGLGLSMVYGFAKQSGGDVTIESMPDHGTTVRLVLPRATGTIEQPTTNDVPSVPKGDGETVLVIEDDPDVRVMTEAMLAKLGYRVLSAETALAGLDILRAKPALDLVLSDVVLPGGMSGPDMAEHAKAISPDIKILFMSGHAEQSIHLETAVSKGCDLLDKPFRAFELAQRVRAALDR